MRIPDKIAQRISAGIRKYHKVLSLARDRDINESDTVVIIADFLSEVLGFDKYVDITTEFSIRGSYCDLAVKLGGQVRFLIEAKAIGIALSEPHLRQTINYAAQHGVDWVILTNGATWQVYKMRFEQPIEADLVFTMDILGTKPRNREAIERLFLLSREGIAKSAIEEFQQQKDACGPSLIGALLRSDPLLSALRRELRRISPAAKIDESELREILSDDVLKREVVVGDEAKSAATRVKRASGRLLRKTPKKPASPPAGPDSDSTTVDPSNAVRTLLEKSASPTSLSTL